MITNFVPFEDPRFAIGDGTLIPCLLRDVATNRRLPLSESLQHRYGSSRSYDSAGIQVVHNSAEEVRAVVDEAISRIEGSWTDDVEAWAEQDRFWEWAERCGLSSSIPEGPWTKGYYRSRLGTAFLRTHTTLLMS